MALAGRGLIAPPFNLDQEYLQLGRAASMGDSMGGSNPGPADAILSADLSATSAAAPAATIGI